MESLAWSGVAMLLASVTTVCGGGPRARVIRAPCVFKPVEFSPPDAERVVLDNGMVVYLLEDHELPLVTINATLRTGSWLDPADKVGLAGMTGAVMRTGGGGGLSARSGR